MKHVGVKNIFRDGVSYDKKIEYLHLRAERIDRGSGYGDCWEDTVVSKSNSNYPQMNGSQGVHTVVWYILYSRLGRRPEVTGHICNSRACINPTHIEEINDQLNVIDSAQFGSSKGSKSTPLCPVADYIGVSWYMQQRKWHAHGPMKHGKQPYYGRFDTQQEAARETLPRFEQALLAMPAHIRATRIWQRNHEKIVSQMIELGSAQVVQQAA